MRKQESGEGRGERTSSSLSFSGPDWFWGRSGLQGPSPSLPQPPRRLAATLALRQWAMPWAFWYVDHGPAPLPPQWQRRPALRKRRPVEVKAKVPEMATAVVKVMVKAVVMAKAMLLLLLCWRCPLEPPPPCQPPHCTPHHPHHRNRLHCRPHSRRPHPPHRAGPSHPPARRLRRRMQPGQWEWPVRCLWRGWKRRQQLRPRLGLGSSQLLQP